MPRATIDRRTFLSALPFLPNLARARSGSGAVLAREAPADPDPAGYLVSEKYDGVRALWDGRQLRFRSGRAVPAPSWFTSRLPRFALDGELWAGRGHFDLASGTLRQLLPDDLSWQQLRYMVFELPGAEGDFAARAARLADVARQLAWPALQAAPQQVVDGRRALQRLLDATVAAGGEGLVLHRADAAFEAGRSGAVLKLKPVQDAEAVVLQVLPGRGRHLGRMGALRVRNGDGVEFLVGTGFSDAQREEPPPAGNVITYAYRGFTATGVPRFASFLRLHDGL